MWIVAMAGCSPASAPPGGTASTAQDVAALRSAIENTNPRFLDAFKRGDKAAMLAYYTEDAVVMMPNQPASRGRAAIDQSYTEFLSQMSYKDGGVRTQDVMVSGDLAVETGTYTWTLTMKSGGEISDNGKYVTVWKRQADGSWKIARDINNSDLPKQ
jgi:uncharacterized protein (TIGR02246 family)